MFTKLQNKGALPVNLVLSQTDPNIFELNRNFKFNLMMAIVAGAIFGITAILFINALKRTN